MSVWGPFLPSGAFLVLHYKQKVDLISKTSDAKLIGIHLHQLVLKSIMQMISEEISSFDVITGWWVCAFLCTPGTV